MPAKIHQNLAGRAEPVRVMPDLVCRLVQQLRNQIVRHRLAVRVGELLDGLDGARVSGLQGLGRALTGLDLGQGFLKRNPRALGGGDPVQVDRLVGLLGVEPLV